MVIYVTNELIPSSQFAKKNKALEKNLKTQLEKHNNIMLSDSEFKRVFTFTFFDKFTLKYIYYKFILEYVWQKLKKRNR